jgi:hypothetical protein
MEVVWRCSAKILEYGIWGQGRYGGWRGEFGAGILGRDSGWGFYGGKDVSEGALGIHVRVIVNAGGFVTITTASPRFLARNARLAANDELWEWS